MMTLHDSFKTYSSVWILRSLVKFTDLKFDIIDKNRNFALSLVSLQL